jgi:hypothetical protein
MPHNKTESSEAKAPTFTAGDLKKLIGLTYRQLNDWESRAGILESERLSTERWRKFTTEQVLALATCAALRRQFSLPLEKLGELRRWLMGIREDENMDFYADIADQIVAGVERDYADLLSLTGKAREEALKDSASRYVLREYWSAKLDTLRRCPIRYAFQCVSLFGNTIYLYTDCEDIFMLLFEENFVSAIAHRLHSKPLIIFPLNSIFNELNTTLGKPLMKRDQWAPPLSESLDKLYQREEVTTNEREALKLIRNKEYRRVSLVTNNGTVIRAEVEGEVYNKEQKKQAKKIISSITKGDFSNVSIQQANGELVRLVRKETIKFNTVTGTT